jgi:hypothetical protein
MRRDTHPEGRKRRPSGRANFSEWHQPPNTEPNMLKMAPKKRMESAMFA